MNYLIPMFLAHVPLIGKLIYDYRQFLRRQAVKHGLEWVVVLILELPVAYLFAPHNIFKEVIALGMICFYLWLMFDGVYNLLRKESWWYIGSPDTEPGWYSKDSWTEKFFRRIGIAGQVSIKLGGLLLFTTIFYLLHDKA
jgi:hypothetical protein